MSFTIIFNDVRKIEEELKTSTNLDSAESFFNAAANYQCSVEILEREKQAPRPNPDVIRRALGDKKEALETIKGVLDQHELQENNPSFIDHIRTYIDDLELQVNKELPETTKALDAARRNS